MSGYVHRTASVQCDGCGDLPDTSDCRTLKDARTLLRDRGWRIRRDGDWCRNCTSRKVSR